MHVGSVVVLARRPARDLFYSHGQSQRKTWPLCLCTGNQNAKLVLDSGMESAASISATVCERGVDVGRIERLSEFAGFADLIRDSAQIVE